MRHVEVRHAHLFAFSLAQLGALVLGLIVVVALVVGLVVWRRGRGSR